MFTKSHITPAVILVSLMLSSNKIRKLYLKQILGRVSLPYMQQFNQQFKIILHFNIIVIGLWYSNLAFHQYHINSKIITDCMFLSCHVRVSE